MSEPETTSRIPRLLRVLLLLPVLTLAAGGCGAGRESGSDHPPAVTVTLSDARAEPAGEGVSETRVCLRIVNQAREPERILSVSAPVSRVTRMMAPVPGGEAEASLQELHAGFKLDAGATLQLSPERSHLLLQNLTGPLRAGETFVLRVHCRNAGVLETTVTVQN